MIRRYIKHSDNSAAYGYAIIEDIQGSGEFRLPINWTRAPQDAIITFAQGFNLPPEYVPSSGSTLLRLAQIAPGGQSYSIYTHDDVLGGSATTVSALDHIHIINVDYDRLISPQAWYIDSSGVGKADSIVFHVKEFTGETELYAILHHDHRVTGNMIYFGGGTDVSSTYGLPTGTRWSVSTSLSSGDNIAEMVFVDGAQIVGDIYSPYYDYGGGAYDMFQMEDGTVEFVLVDPITVSQTLMFTVFLREPQPKINLREDDSFDDEGCWVQFWDIPKGDLWISFYVS